MTTATIAFIGLGVMGAPMAGHLARAGHQVKAFDLSLSAVQRACELCPALGSASSAAEAADGADVVFTMLPSGKPVRDVILGSGGVAAALKPGSLVIDTSSSEPWITRENSTALQPLGIALVDAPVSGAEAGAIAGDLVFMVGASDDDFPRAQRLLSSMGARIFHLGQVGCGHTMKAINNLITAVTFMATGEGLLLGKRYGVDPAVMNQVLNVSTGGSWITRNHIEQRILSRRFDDPFKLALMNKDVGIAGKLAQDADFPMPLATAARALWAEATAANSSDASVSELIRWLEQRANLAVTPGRG
ncbi:MAG: NAD(P)-dependent oxidoreductase [Gammaproteobacteria bacterium]|nr:NAD(P)-dependent oxidoreductase [Gammaproteobacteria bacterium]